jgi:hypothetical protein
VCGRSSLAVESNLHSNLGPDLGNKFSDRKSAPRIVENPQTLAAGEAPGGVSAVPLPDWRAWDICS